LNVILYSRNLLRTPFPAAILTPINPRPEFLFEVDIRFRVVGFFSDYLPEKIESSIPHNRQYFIGLNVEWHLLPSRPISIIRIYGDEPPVIIDARCGEGLSEDVKNAFLLFLRGEIGLLMHAADFQL
jgi:hypothetical protein